MAALTRNEKILVLFDVDGTLTAPREEATEEMRHFLLNTLKERVVVGIVGGSDQVKQQEQMGPNIKLVDYFKISTQKNNILTIMSLHCVVPKYRHKTTHHSLSSMDSNWGSSMGVV